MRSLTVQDIAIPVLGFGTAGLVGDDASAKILRAIDMGYRHIDTAQCYDNESEVGRALVASGLPRGEFFVTTKVWIDRFAEEEVERSVEESLSRLGLETGDLVLLNWPNPKFSIGRRMRGLSRVHRAGRARSIGLSNFPIALMDEARAATDQPLIVNQVEFHPFLHQQPLLSALRARGMILAAHTPLARGRVFSDPTVQAIAARHGRTCGQIVLRWLLQHPGVVVIPGSSNEQHVRENLGVFDFTLSNDEMDLLSGLGSPSGRVLDWREMVPRWD